MGNYSFRGGEHPAEAKLTRELPLQEFLPQGEMVFPLGQHIGKPASPVVAKGDEVLAGQLIAQAEGFVSANIYSSCSGKVKAIDRRITGAGVMAQCIIIENDGQYKKAPGVGEKAKIKHVTGEQILEKIKNAGIVGLGGAGFPTHVKLAPKDPGAIKYFIANGAECEPGITCDDRLMRERPADIVEGMRLVLKLFPNASGIIAIEENKPEAIEAMKGACQGDPKISVRVLKVKYPQGSERNLVYMATGAYMPSGSLPADLGCVVDNVATIYSIYRAVAFNEPPDGEVHDGDRGCRVQPRQPDRETRHPGRGDPGALRSLRGCEENPLRRTHDGPGPFLPGCPAGEDEQCSYLHAHRSGGRS